MGLGCPPRTNLGDHDIADVAMLAAKEDFLVATSVDKRKLGEVAQLSL